MAYCITSFGHIWELLFCKENNSASRNVTVYFLKFTVLLKKKLADESSKKQELQSRLQRLQNDLIKVT